MKFNDDSFSLGNKPFGRIETRRLYGDDPDVTYEIGDVITPRGVVSIYAQGDNLSFYTTQLQFAYENRLYSRVFEKRYSPRGIVTKANQFTKDVIHKNLPF